LQHALKGMFMIILSGYGITLTRYAQFPVKDVKELEAQLFAIQHELHEDRDPHEGKSAEEAYSERLNKLSLTEGGIQEGEVVVKALLARCLLWSEVIQEKCVLSLLSREYSS
jgi:hypothetical protein